VNGRDTTAMDIEPTQALASVSMEIFPENAFAEKVCVPLLRNAQNSDAGWGFHPGSQSRVEPTCWAVKALASRAAEQNSRDIARGLDFLLAAQLADGSWPSTPEEKTGCWVTSLACWALSGVSDAQYSKAVARGLSWICEDWPRDSSWLQRWVRKFSSAGRLTKQNLALRGWGWTPHTSSWTEPTAFALLALESPVAAQLSSLAEKRKTLGEALLYDRMCAGGGWNCGNPEVYGVAGEPLVLPTTWALLALRHHPQRRENIESLAWMEKNFTRIQAPASFAAAKICAAAYGRSLNRDAPKGEEFHFKNESLGSVQVAAWTVLAEGDPTRWLAAGGKI
jgi:hypothetical protein